MTPEDTTRLREHAEAVRNAGARIVQTRDPGGPAYWAAHQDLREAKARLYLGAPPDSIILALLDEVERLRKIFDDAGQGEHNVLALIDHYQQRAMEADERLRGIVGRVSTILSDEGCDCYCDCDSHHLPECELCLGCRIGNEVTP